jgi:hypothetical protein
MVPRLGSWAATVGQVPCAVAVADQGVYLRGDNLIERWDKPQVRSNTFWRLARANKRVFHLIVATRRSERCQQIKRD